MMVSVKKKKKKLISLEDKDRILKKTNEELLRKYSEQNTLMRRTACKLVKSDASRFVEIAMYNGWAIL